MGFELLIFCADNDDGDATIPQPQAAVRSFIVRTVYGDCKQ